MKTMTVETVVENLDNTIKGKEYFLITLKGETPKDFADKLAIKAAIHFLNINIEELQKIRDDVASING